MAPARTPMDAKVSQLSVQVLQANIKTSQYRLYAKSLPNQASEKEGCQVFVFPADRVLWQMKFAQVCI